MKMTDKYHLKWNSHHEEAFENFHLLRDREIFTDVTLSCEGQIMKAHRVILSAGSAYFERTLPRDSSHTPIVYFHGIPMAKLRLVIEFIYSGAVEVPSPDLEKFIELSECLEVKGLKSRPRSSSNPSTSQRTESSSGKSSASASPPPATKHQSTTSTQSSQPAKKLKLAQDLSKAEPQPEKNEETDSTIAVNNVKDEHNDEVSLKEEEILGMGDEAQDEQYDDSSPGEDTGALPSDSMELSLTSDEVPQNIPPEISPEKDSSICPIIHFHGIDMMHLRLLVDFMYSGEVDVPSTELEQFIALADSLEVKGLKGDRSKRSDVPPAFGRPELQSSFGRPRVAGPTSFGRSMGVSFQPSTSGSTMGTQLKRKLPLAVDSASGLQDSQSSPSPVPEKKSMPESIIPDIHNQASDSAASEGFVKTEADEAEVEEVEEVEQSYFAEEEGMGAAEGENSNSSYQMEGGEEFDPNELPANIPPEIAPEKCLSIPGQSGICCERQLLHCIHQTLMKVREGVWRGRHSGSSKTFYFCSWCGHKTFVKTNIVAHSRTHTGEKPYDCWHCGVKFARKDYLSSHIFKHHLVLPCLAFKKCSCIFCQSVARGRNGIWSGKDARGQCRIYFCEYCTFASSRSSNVIAHARIHTGEKPFKEEAFEESYVDSAQNDLSLVVWSDTESQINGLLEACVYLSLRVVEESEKRQFLTLKRGEDGILISQDPLTGCRLHICPYCTYRSGYKSHTVEHVRTHTGDRPFRCDMCGKSFCRRSHLRRHMTLTKEQGGVWSARQVGVGSKIYLCSFCPYKSPIRTNALAHVRTHTNERPFQCSLCGVAYKQNVALRRHLATWHNP
ncbi:unnamed protein product [Darwinula stevensoni]|uniref:Uncharacterized protein n=1 Tax=Darwinula stevensoni TaxID=69355 RepID=A0A7R8X646_9CRUS|nr:unnamed protein product [Darwinula stevensoni]CAG0887244.1 unnamed protein product [Darwinula stevensoni]